MRQDAKTWQKPYSSRPPFVFGITDKHLSKNLQEKRPATSVESNRISCQELRFFLNVLSNVL